MSLKRARLPSVHSGISLAAFLGSIWLIDFLPAATNRPNIILIMVDDFGFKR